MLQVDPSSPPERALNKSLFLYQNKSEINPSRQKSRNLAVAKARLGQRVSRPGQTRHWVLPRLFPIITPRTVLLLQELLLS